MKRKEKRRIALEQDKLQNKSLIDQLREEEEIEEILGHNVEGGQNDTVQTQWPTTGVRDYRAE